jgi:hypothetical protein
MKDLGYERDRARTRYYAQVGGKDTERFLLHEAVEVIIRHCEELQPTKQSILFSGLLPPLSPGSQ